MAVFALSCTRYLSWSKEPIGEEVNLAFTMEQNLIHLTTVRIDNRPGRFILGTAAPRTIVDSRFALGSSMQHALQISEKQTVQISPAPHDLRGVADAIIGVEPWRNHAISIDYRSGLVTYQKEGIHQSQMTVFRYPAEPMITVQVNGRDVAAIVDTTSPDTLVLPGRDARANANVRIATTDFGSVDVQYANVSQARVGNRLLSRFLITIDYGRKVVGLWRDPRIPLREPPEGEIRAQYDALERAFATQSIADILATRDPKFEVFGPEGQHDDYERMAEYTRQWFVTNKPPIEVKFTIQSIDYLSPDEAAVRVLQRASRYQERDGKLRKVEHEVVQRETWIRTPNGWRMRKVDEIDLKNRKRWIDGVLEKK